LQRACHAFLAGVPKAMPAANRTIPCEHRRQPFEKTRTSSKFRSDACRRANHEKKTPAKQIREDISVPEADDVIVSSGAPSSETEVLPFARDGRPFKRLEPCPICDWVALRLDHFGTNSIACARCDPPQNPASIG
jgi:hypothetical protein